jgi:hypothetical protein
MAVRRPTAVCATVKLVTYRVPARRCRLLDRHAELDRHADLDCDAEADLVV